MDLGLLVICSLTFVIHLIGPLLAKRVEQHLGLGSAGAATADLTWLLLSARSPPWPARSRFSTFQRLSARYVQAFDRHRSVWALASGAMSPVTLAHLRESLVLHRWQNILGVRRGAPHPVGRSGGQHAGDGCLDGSSGERGRGLGGRSRGSGSASVRRRRANAHVSGQDDRKPGLHGIYWSIVKPRDDARLRRTREFYASGALRTGADWLHAAAEWSARRLLCWLTRCA
jgi:Alternate to MurJ